MNNVLFVPRCPKFFIRRREKPQRVWPGVPHRTPMSPPSRRLFSYPKGQARVTQQTQMGPLTAFAYIENHKTPKGQLFSDPKGQDRVTQQTPRGPLTALCRASAPPGFKSSPSFLHSLHPFLASSPFFRVLLLVYLIFGAFPWLLFLLYFGV